MGNKKTDFGNITLGKINKMLISFIGESTFYYFCEEFAKEGQIENWQSKDAFQKYVHRLLAEEDSDFAGLNVANNSSIPVLVCKILDRFVTDYGCMPVLVNQIKKIAFDFYTGYKEFKYPIYETYNFYRAIFCENYEEYAKKMIATIVKVPQNLWLLPLYFCPAVKKYNFAYDFLSKVPEIGSKEELYRKLADYYQDKYFGEMGLLEKTPRSATAVALADRTTIAPVTEEDFGEFFKENPARVLMVLQQMSRNLRKRSNDFVRVCLEIKELSEKEGKA